VAEPSKRQEYILGLIVREYVREPTPVSSKALVERYGLDFSSATIRNDMATLEELGLIASPHTSAGRLPTEAGYRYFVQKLIGDSELTLAEQQMIRHQFHQSRLDVEQWLQLASSVLAQTARTASLVTAPVGSPTRFKHIELIGTQGRMVLMVLVLEGGDVRQQMLTLAEPVVQVTLSEVAMRINSQCAGLGADQIRGKAAQQPTLDQEVINLAADLLEQADSRHRIIYSDGLVNILDPGYLLDRLEISDPERRDDLTKALVEADSPGARQTLHLLQEHSLLEAILGEVLSGDVQGVRVMIGGEGRWDELSHTSMILSHYGVHGHLTGALGVLGPTRLHYGRAISAVRYVAGLITDMMIEVYGGQGL
jgi:heat-inducible transcriptional repressor